MKTKDYEIELIKKAQSGEMKSFEELVYRYDRKVMNIAYHYRNNKEDANDIYQEVFMRVFKGIKNFQFKSEFSTWLYRITANVCISFKEKNSRVEIDSLDKNVFDGDESISFADSLKGDSRTDSLTNSAEISKYVNIALDKLPNQQKLAFTLKYFDGLKIKEIAKVMGCSDGAVKKYIFIATNKLRGQLKFLVDGK